jgi:hypothetical protein
MSQQQINPPSYGIRPGPSQQQQGLPFVQQQQQQMGQHKVMSQQQRFQHSQQQAQRGGGSFYLIKEFVFKNDF